MELFEAVEKRRTIRDFTSDELDQTTIKKIISAGLKAPTNDHMRDWHFIVIQDKQIMMKLLDIIPKGISEEDMKRLIKDWNLTDAGQQACYRNAVPKQHRMLADASAVIIPLFKLKTDILHPDNLSHLNGFASIWCCIENMFLATTALNLGMTLRIPRGREEAYAREVLGYPGNYQMPCFIGIGHPRKNTDVIKQRKICTEDRVHWNQW